VLGWASVPDDANRVSHSAVSRTTIEQGRKLSLTDVAIGNAPSLVPSTTRNRGTR
jgi:hypothetical protein